MPLTPTGVVAGLPLPIGSVPHLRVPFAVNDQGNAATVEQGTSDEIVQCVAMLVGTRPGTRYLLPAYGIVDPTFSGFDQVGLQLATKTYEPRAVIAVTVGPGNTEQVSVQVQGGTP